MKSIKIEIPEGFEVETFNKETGTVSFKEKPKSITEQIKSVEDVLSYHGLTQEGIDKKFQNVPKHLKNQYIVELLVEALNEGWEADWHNSNKYKYYPWFDMSSGGFRCSSYGSWRSDAASAVGVRFCFKSKELAEYAGMQFESLYKSFMLK